MKHLKLFMITLLTLLFVSCFNKFDYQANEQEQIKDNVEKVFGVQFPNTQNWCTSVNSSVKVYVNGNKNINKVQVLLSNVTDSISTIKLLNQADVKDGETVSFTFDTPLEYTNLYIAFINNTNQFFIKNFNLGDKEVYFETPTKTRILTRSLSQDYNIPSVNPVITGTVETFANQRGWLPGEVFYTVNYQTLNSNDYTDEFKSIFRSILFNYFPNGRQYNNIK